jgi:hypothetical protein
MSAMMLPARISWSARNGSSPASSNPGRLYSSYTSLKSIGGLAGSRGLPSGSRGPGFTPKGTATKASVWWS